MKEEVQLNLNVHNLIGVKTRKHERQCIKTGFKLKDKRWKTAAWTKFFGLSAIDFIFLQGRCWSNMGSVRDRSLASLAAHAAANNPGTLHLVKPSNTSLELPIATLLGWYLLRAAQRARDELLKLPTGGNFHRLQEILFLYSCLEFAKHVKIGWVINCCLTSAGSRVKPSAWTFWWCKCQTVWQRTLFFFQTLCKQVVAELLFQCEIMMFYFPIKILMLFPGMSVPTHNSP